MSAQIIQFPTRLARDETLLDDWRKRVRAEYPDLDDATVEQRAEFCSDIERTALRAREKRLAGEEREAAHLMREVTAAIDLWLLLRSRAPRTARAPAGDPFATDSRAGCLRVAMLDPQWYRDHMLKCIAEEAARLQRLGAKRPRRKG